MPKMFKETTIVTYHGNETRQRTFESKPGIYHIECWGARGRQRYGGACGGYVSGFIKFEKSTQLYLYIGEEGKMKQTTYAFNGGGTGQSGGGGASDVRIQFSENWSNFESLKSRIIVAGGGAGSDGSDTEHEAGGAGGGLIGKPSRFNKGQGGTQTRGGNGTEIGQFGIGGSNDRFGDGTVKEEPDGNGAGGGGYFGGGTSTVKYLYGGGGGSSFISGHDGCNAISNSSTDPFHMIMTNQSVHYLNYRFYHTDMIDGDSEMPSPFGGIETGHCYSGAIRISKVELVFCTKQLLFPSLHYFIPFVSIALSF